MDYYAEISLQPTAGVLWWRLKLITPQLLGIHLSLSYLNLITVKSGDQVDIFVYL